MAAGRKRINGARKDAKGAQQSAIAHLAGQLKKNRTTVWRYVQRGMPLDEAAAREWLAANVKTKTGKAADEVTRLTSARADLAELEAAEKRGELLAYEDVLRWANGVTVAVASQLEGLPGRMASTLAGMTDAAEVRQALLDEVRRIRSALAAAIRALVPGDGELGDAATGEDGGSVGGSDEGTAAGKR